MKILQFKTYFINELRPIYDLAECESMFYIILETNHSLKRLDLALDLNLNFNEQDIENWEKIITQLKLEKPLQYILGKTTFYGLDFFVNESVLVPRQETEELVDWILQQFKTNKKEPLKILDIGTGSGCIAISLAKNISTATVFAIDLSEKAIATAKKNALDNQVNIHFEIMDVLAIDDLKQKFDIIVSNPPYIREKEKIEIKKNVMECEPQLALFVTDEKPLIFYERIALLAQKSLNKNGKLFFEINEYLGKETTDLLEKMNFESIQLKQDIYGKDRFVTCIFAKK